MKKDTKIAGSKKIAGSMAVSDRGSAIKSATKSAAAIAKGHCPEKQRKIMQPSNPSSVSIAVIRQAVKEVIKNRASIQ